MARGYEIYGKNRKFISSRLRVMFFLLYLHTDDGGFDDFPKISDHFPKILQNLSEGHARCQRFPKLSEDFQRLPKTFEEDPKIFRS